MCRRLVRCLCQRAPASLPTCPASLPTCPASLPTCFGVSKCPPVLLKGGSFTNQPDSCSASLTRRCFKQVASVCVLDACAATCYLFTFFFTCQRLPWQVNYSLARCRQFSSQHVRQHRSVGIICQGPQLRPCPTLGPTLQHEKSPNPEPGREQNSIGAAMRL